MSCLARVWRPWSRKDTHLVRFLTITTDRIVLTHQSCFAIEHLHSILGQRRAALGRFYFDFQDTDKQDVCSVIGELSKQLLLQATSVPEEVWKLFRKHTAISTKEAQQIFTLLLSSFELTYLCLDALDECEPQSRKALLSFLGLLIGSKLRVFCTGRFSVKDQAKDLLRPFSPKVVEIFAHETDIRQYIEEEIAQDDHKDAMDEQLQEEITKQLVSQKL